MKVTKKFLSSVVLIFAIGGPISAWAQDIYSFSDLPGRPEFYVDYAAFKSDSAGMVNLELYYKIPNRTLQFVRKEGLFEAGFEVSFTIYDGHGKQVTAVSRQRSYSTASYERTLSSDDYRISQMSILLPPGKYKIEAHLVDKNSGRDIEDVMKAELPKYDHRNPQLSSVEFVHAFDTSQIDFSFMKGNLSIIPSVYNRFTGDSSARLLYYYEIYQGSERAEEIMVETRILTTKLDPVYSDSNTAHFIKEENLLRQLRNISLAGIKSGDYTLDISLIGKRNREVDNTRIAFSIYWTPESMVLYDPEKAIAQLKYIADPGELKPLKEAGTPQERLAKWNEFWLSRDPSPGTSENETRDDYYSRIKYANEHFGILKKEGWQTDRGMVLLEYGVPDQVEDYPFELNSKAYQIWYYYQMRERRQFLFVDEWGDGDFRLQFPYDGRPW
jgi:GWxTD domain-containing protein